VESAKTFDTIFVRLLTATESKSESDFARSIGITPQSVNGARKRGKVPPDWVQSVAEKTGVSSDWLFFGRVPMRPDNAQPTAPEPGKINPIPEGEPQWMAPEAAPSMGYTLVPKVRARLAAGTGSLETDGEVIGLYAFKTDFLKRKGAPKRMVLMDVAGDSMEPVLMDSDTVLIDEGQNEIISGGLFAVSVESEVFVKYLDRIPGKLVLRSKNDRYEPIEVDMNGQISDSVRIIGRVIWSCREYVR